MGEASLSDVFARTSFEGDLICGPVGVLGRCSRADGARCRRALSDPDDGDGARAGARRHWTNGGLLT